MALRTLTALRTLATLVRPVARALTAAMGHRPAPPADDTDGYEVWLNESFAQ